MGEIPGILAPTGGAGPHGTMPPRRRGPDSNFGAFFKKAVFEFVDFSVSHVFSEPRNHPGHAGSGPNDSLGRYYKKIVFSQPNIYFYISIKNIFSIKADI